MLYVHIVINYQQETAPGENYYFGRREIGICQYWWLTPIILATQEAEIRRITVQSQPRQIVP
jgi:hypothetical protein